MALSSAAIYISPRPSATEDHHAPGSNPRHNAIPHPPSGDGFGLMPTVTTDRAMSDGARVPAHLRECRDCGQLQVVPALEAGARASCLRCDAVLRHTRRD